MYMLPMDHVRNGYVKRRHTALVAEKPPWLSIDFGVLIGSGYDAMMVYFMIPGSYCNYTTKLEFIISSALTMAWPMCY